MTWRRIASRQNVDITTISGIDLVFYHLAKQATHQNGELFFTHLKDKNFTHYAAIDFDDVGRYAYRTYFNSPEQIQRYEQEGRLLLRDVKKKTSIWKKKLAKNISTRDLCLAFQDFKEQFTTINFIYSIASFIAIETWQKDCDKVVKKLITQNNLTKEQESISASIYKPYKKTALMEIQEKLRQGADAKKLATEYQFLRSWSVVWHKPLEASWFSSLTPRGEQPRSYDTKKIKALLRPTPEETRFLDLAPYITFFKDWRDDLRRKHCYEWSFFFEQLAHHWNCAVEDPGYLSLDEIENALTTTLDRQIINQRKNKDLIITPSDREITIFDSKLPDQYLIIIKETELQLHTLELKGLGVSQGKITGPVTIVRSHHDIKKVKEGDVLIANTTHPNYLPAMYKAAAFVTNEGGMLSHAAIVAREIKKPCVVGTKSATELFKDGDIVEVDATKGVVHLAK